MSNFKGRHLGFLAMLCVGWAATRVAIVNWDGGGSGHLVTAIAAPPALSIARTTKPITNTQLTDFRSFCCFRTAVSANESGMAAVRNDKAGRTSNRFAVQIIAGNGASTFPRKSVLEPPRKLPIDALTNAAVPPLDRQRSLRAHVYAYNFLRAGGGRGGLAAGGQYGGSQSGLIATFPLIRTGDAQKSQSLALLVRAAVAHDDLDERELAIGMRLRPLAELPVSITAERRFRHNRKDAFAIYASGGVSDVQLPLNVRAEGFAQAGVVSGKEAGPFFDAFVRADRKMLSAQPVQIHAGAGAWAGGQRGVARLDIGPSLRADIALADTSLRLTLDWRFRVAGNATPGNGPALTLSTGF